MINKLIAASCFTLTLVISGCVQTSNMDLGLIAGASMDMFKAATLSDQEVRTMAKQTTKYQDGNNKVADSSSKYSKRLERLTKSYMEVDGVRLNFKVYIVDDINAFAVPDGSVRVFSGLMDLMDDDELMFVVGHEIGHVALGHSKKQMQLAYVTSATRKATASQSSTYGRLATSELGDFSEALIHAQFSQSEEQSADDYGLQHMKDNELNTQKAVTALGKLSDLGGSSNILSSHPDATKRATRIKEQL